MIVLKNQCYNMAYYVNDTQSKIKTTLKGQKSKS
jgi:hypothetical protein